MSSSCAGSCISNSVIFSATGEILSVSSEGDGIFLSSSITGDGLFSVVAAFVSSTGDGVFVLSPVHQVPYLLLRVSALLHLAFPPFRQVLFHIPEIFPSLSQMVPLLVGLELPLFRKTTSAIVCSKLSISISFLTSFASDDISILDSGDKYCSIFT
ncbi:UNVERIFIED_CONTAM: hypothetical protein NCL1_54464 [Trichonephila clavipes]